MECWAMAAGCILSFLCGAWVREPIRLWEHRPRQKQPSGTGAPPVSEQWENFWNYSGEDPQ